MPLLRCKPWRQPLLWGMRLLLLQRLRLCWLWLHVLWLECWHLLLWLRCWFLLLLVINMLLCSIGLSVLSCSAWSVGHAVGVAVDGRLC